MYYQFSILKDKQIPQAIDSLCELIDDVYDNLSKKINVRRHKDKEFEEYGVYIGGNKIEIFFGMWFRTWEHTGLPVCVCLEKDSGVSKIRSKFEGFVQHRPIEFDSVINFQGYLVASFNLDFLHSLGDVSKLIQIIDSLCAELQMGLYFVK